MAMLEPHYNKADYAQRGQTLYERDIRPRLVTGDEDKFVAIDVETGAYVLDTDDYTATERLLVRHPTAQIWLCRVGHRAAYRSPHCAAPTVTPTVEVGSPTGKEVSSTAWLSDTA